MFFEDYITKDEGLYSVTASNICGSISYSVMVRILEDEQEFDWMTYRRTKQIIPRTKGVSLSHVVEHWGVALTLTTILFSTWKSPRPDKVFS